MKRLLAVMALVTATPAMAQTAPNDPNDPYAQFQQDAQAAERLADEITADKKTECMRAIGISAFCDCFAEHIPVVINFPQYVLVIAGKLTPDDEKLTSAILRTREACVGGK